MSVKNYEDCYREIGKIIYLCNVLDSQALSVIIKICNLPQDATNTAIIATIDVSRKMEIIRTYSKVSVSDHWKYILGHYCDELKIIVDARNEAAHSVIMHDSGKFVLHKPTLSSFMKRYKKGQSHLFGTPIEEIMEASDRARRCFDIAEYVRVNFVR